MGERFEYFDSVFHTCNLRLLELVMSLFFSSFNQVAFFSTDLVGWFLMFSALFAV